MLQASGLSMIPQASILATTAQQQQQQQQQQDKINRELFVGNTPPGTTELLLLHFLNAAMRRVGLCQPHETPILNCRLNPKFAFVELVTAEMANQAMNMNGIPFLGAVLKISRPSKYNGPMSIGTIRTWQQMTGATLPAGTLMDAESEKMSRELFVGNTTPEMSEQMIKEFLGNAMEQVGLAIMPGNPIQACRMSGKFAFIELRTAQEATNALNLNNIPFMGAALRVGRPSKWNGPPDRHGNWEDILAKYMAGELVLPSIANYPNANTTITNNQPAVSPTTTTTTNIAPPISSSPPVSSRVVELQHMLTESDLANDADYQEIFEDTWDECARFGQLINVVIPRLGQVGATKVFLEYATEQDAAAAIAALEGRTFDGRRVQAQFYDPTRFQSGDYS